MERLVNSDKTIDGQHHRDTNTNLLLSLVDGEKSIAEIV